MRLIDAKQIEKQIKETFETQNPVLMGQMLRWIRKQQTIDAVPVVRCGGCKYGRKCGDEISCYHPEYALREGVWSYEEDFYCKYGEPKEGADNG